MSMLVDALAGLWLSYLAKYFGNYLGPAVSASMHKDLQDWYEQCKFWLHLLQFFRAVGVHDM